MATTDAAQVRYLVSHIADTRASLARHENKGDERRARSVRAYLATQVTRLDTLTARMV